MYICIYTYNIVEEEKHHNLILLLYYKLFHAQRQSSDVDRGMTQERQNIRTIIEFNWSRNEKVKVTNIRSSQAA